MRKRTQEAEQDWEDIVKARIRWMHYANQQGWKFPTPEKLREVWPLDHFDARGTRA